MRQVHEAAGQVAQALDDRPVQPDPDWELHDHRPQAPEGADSRLTVQLHRLALLKLGVVLETVADLLHLRLQGLHPGRRFQLLEGQRVECHADDDGERDDGERHAFKQHVIEEYQPVQHRLKEQEDKYVAQDFKHCRRLILQGEYPHGLP